jgi:hypothetical protein
MNPGMDFLNMKNTRRIEVAPIAITPPNIKVQKTDCGSLEENKIQEDSHARKSTTQASIILKKTIEPMAADRLIPKLIRARWEA